MKLNAKLVATLGAVALGTAAPAVAQNAAGTADPYATTAPAEEDDRDFPWGLLGLLGLAGLLGRKRDRDDDNRRTGTGTGTGTTNR